LESPTKTFPLLYFLIFFAGIIGGSIAGLDGFLAGYLSLTGDEGGAVFICHLKDGRYFVAHSNPEIYNKLLEFSYEQNSFGEKNESNEFLLL